MIGEQREYSVEHVHRIWINSDDNETLELLY